MTSDGQKFPQTLSRCAKSRPYYRTKWRPEVATPIEMLQFTLQPISMAGRVHCGGHFIWRKINKMAVFMETSFGMPISQSGRKSLMLC
jgi:hypothetical protein